MYNFLTLVKAFRRRAHNISRPNPIKWLSINTLITAILLITICSTGVTGCYHDNMKNSTGRDEKPFFPDRVVTVRITMTEEDWESSRTNAMAEEYAKANLSYDGKLIKDVAVRPKGGSSLMVAAASGTARFSLKVDFNWLFPKFSTSIKHLKPCQ